MNIFEPHNIIFVEIGTRLNLDEESWNFARIRKSMFFADGNVGGLVFGEQLGFLAFDDL
jgi:hypothetical protein